MASEPVAVLAADAELARTRMGNTIDAIQDRLNPRRIVGEAVERVQGGGVALATQARTTLKAHPLAVGAAVAAIGLALLARSKLANAKINLGDNFSSYTDYDDDYGNEAAPRGGYADEQDDDGVDPVDPGLAASRRRARDLAAETRDSVSANPLVSIGVGLLAGALLGAIFPSTDAERDLLGDQGQKLGAAARAAGRRAREELESAGISLDAVRDRAGAVADKARAAAGAVVSAARDELNTVRRD